MISYEIQVEESFYQIDIGTQGVPLSASLAKAGKLPFQSGNPVLTIPFTTFLSDTSLFIPVVTMYNVTDSFPQDLVVRVKSFQTNQMVVEVNAPPDTGNYYASWAVLPIANG